MTPIAVVIVNYNTREHLRACLATVQSERPSEVVVVDNASSDGSVEMMRNEYPWVTLHANRKNLGYGAAANQGVASCTAPYVLLLNADTLLESGGLRKLSAYLDQHLRAAIVGPRLVNSHGAPQRSWFPFPSRYVCHTWTTLPQLDAFCGRSTGGRLIHYLFGFREQELGIGPDMRNRVVPWVLGAAVAVRREAFKAVGGFDESFFMYFEETDLCYRLACAGWQVHFTPTTTIVHVGGVSTTQRRAAMMLQFFESEAHFYQRHYSKLLMLQFRLVLGAVILARITVGAIRLYWQTDTSQGVLLSEDLGVWRSILAALWHPQRYLDQAQRGNA
jgi:N-acetylglucosaminyl-diphospho-decaprenol L-rhamnosyltransferase